MINELIGNELRSLRGRFNYTLKDVENKTQIHAQTLCEYENNKRKITVFTLNRILCNAYNQELHIFFKNIYEYSHKAKPLKKEIKTAAKQ